MKKLLVMLLALTMLMTTFGCGKNNGNNDGNSDDNSLAGTYDITVWVSESAGVKELTEKQIKDFMAENEGIVINYTVEGISEADSATQMITDVETGADIFCFAQDQLARLVQAGALLPLGDAAAKTVTEQNDAISVSAATVGGKLYCYPLTSDNGYYMYYDKSVIPESDIDDLAKIVADCEAAGKNFSMQLGENGGWYDASFFFGTGCVSEWQTDDSGQFVSVNDTFNSAAGLAALKGMQIITKSPNYVSSGNGTDFGAAVPSAVVVSGTWVAKDVQEILGDNYGATDLPSFTVDGKTYHMGSFSGNKLVGVKPQTGDAKKNAVCQQLALYLTSEKCQLERFEAVEWGPSNLAAQQNSAVKSNAALAALAQQNAYAVPQGQIHGSWWSIAVSLAKATETASTDAELQTALDNYTNAINALFSLNGYILVGAWNGWNNADTAFQMEKTNETYTLTINVEQSDYMGGRIVTGGDWDTDHGLAQVVEGADLLAEDGGSDTNMVFLAPGSYTVTWNSASNEITVKKN